jgi:hypothetical protein
MPTGLAPKLGVCLGGPALRDSTNINTIHFVPHENNSDNNQKGIAMISSATTRNSILKNRLESSTDLAGQRAQTWFERLLEITCEWKRGLGVASSFVTRFATGSLKRLDQNGTWPQRLHGDQLSWPADPGNRATDGWPWRLE